MQADEIAALLDRINQKTRVRLLTGTFVSYDSAGPIVDIGNGRILAAFGTAYMPEVGELVMVQFVDGVPYVMGPTVPKPAAGTVTATSGSGSSARVTLATPSGPVGPIPYVGSAPAVGQTMRILWHGGGIAFSATDSVAPVAPSSPGAGGTTTHVDEFTPNAAGTWNTGGGDAATSYFNDEVWDSSTTIGLWFYGSKIADTIPSGAQIQRVQLYIAARQLYGSSPIFATHGYQSPPGSPSMSGGSSVGVKNYEDADLPVSFGNALRSGGGAFGIGTRHGGYNIFKSRNADGQSGRLRITSIY